MLLVPMNCFLWRVDHALEENVLTTQMWIFASYFIRILIFYLFLNVKLFIAAD